MVSKRRNVADSEPGCSKKKARNEEKAKTNETSVSEPLPKKKKSKKSKKEKVVENPVEEEHFELETNSSEEKEDESIVITPLKRRPPTVNATADIPNWPQEHMAELLRRIESHLPSRDHLNYKSRAERMEWNELAFDKYSGVDCRLMWESMQKRLRRFRVLRELVEDAKEWISKPWTNFYRGSKTNRHPDMPRRPLSTYMIFYMNKKDKVLKENPGLEMTGLSKYIAEMYKKISPKVKEKYIELAVAQRKEYEERMDEFYRLHPDLAPSNAKSHANSANDNLPKKPPTPFKLFCEDKLKRNEHELDFEKNLFIEQCKDQWRNMSEKKKVFWINWALDKDGKYQEDMKKYAAENPAYVPSAWKGVLTKEERTIRERMAGKPEKPPNSAYSLFSRLMLGSEDVKRVSPKERMLLIAQQWKHCTDVEKKEYTERVKHMHELYKLQYAEYLESLPEDKRQEELLNNQPKRRTKARKSTSLLPAPSTPKRIKKTAKRAPTKKKEKVEVPKIIPKIKKLYVGEPEPPPATPYLLFVKSYQSSYPERQDAHEVWQSMSDDQRSFHRRVLWDMKKVYIESYENFLKGLTQEELKQYSEWKKTVRMINDSDASSDNHSDSEEQPIPHPVVSPKPSHELRPRYSAYDFSLFRPEPSGTAVLSRRRAKISSLDKRRRFVVNQFIKRTNQSSFFDVPFSNPDTYDSNSESMSESKGFQPCNTMPSFPNEPNSKIRPSRADSDTNSSPVQL